LARVAREVNQTILLVIGGASCPDGRGARGVGTNAQIGKKARADKRVSHLAKSVSARLAAALTVEAATYSAALTGKRISAITDADARVL
jgi:hypothetical protein